jgi:hypothetical protein
MDRKRLNLPATVALRIVDGTLLTAANGGLIA